MTTRRIRCARKEAGWISRVRLEPAPAIAPASLSPQNSVSRPPVRQSPIVTPKRLINTTVSNGVSAADLLTVEATPQTFDTQDMRNASKRYAEVGAPAFRDRLQFKDR